MTEPAEGAPAKKSRGRTKRDEIEARAHVLEEEFKAQVAATRAQIDATTVKIEARTGRNLPLAILIGVGLGVLLIGSLIFIKALFMIFTGALIAFTTFELASALRFAGRDVPRWPSVVAGLASVPAAFYLEDQCRWLVVLGGIVFVAVWRLAESLGKHHKANAQDLWKDVAAGTFVQVYVPFLGSFAVLLAAQKGGEWWALAFLLVVISVDIGAYASGLLFGKHPMAPRISPKKTWEGFAGSVLTALVAGVIVSVFMLQEPWWFGLIFGAVMVFTGTIGDLTESLIKRDLGIKDISTWLPGHGGFLDRLDSILPSAAAAYVLFVIFS
ncbi:phosphatidate cytidylyltransferase [Glaciihabitans sp. INWT7]|uniref:phosphatidate cytidylyltransferase n=1 Tax=Glaciihabitans sp. INWT7 TaxID=2596912 RepID=UPI0016244AD6|nr:phosphatidate cytidylyltransferase [Glaciihabitans sp. INWT7]QNE47363.1 phosphatidate cytidylyltransferase [Glaciihabitans sp. INWT7]